MGQADGVCMRGSGSRGVRVRVVEEGRVPHARVFPSWARDRARVGRKLGKGRARQAHGACARGMGVAMAVCVHLEAGRVQPARDLGCGLVAVR